MQRFTGKMKYLKKNLFIFGYLGFMVNKNLTKEYPEIYSTLMFYIVMVHVHIMIINRHWYRVRHWRPWFWIWNTWRIQGNLCACLVQREDGHQRQTAGRDYSWIFSDLKKISRTFIIFPIRTSKYMYGC